MNRSREDAKARSKAEVKLISALKNGRYINASFRSEWFVRLLDEHREYQPIDFVTRDLARSQCRNQPVQ